MAIWATHAAQTIEPPGAQAAFVAKLTPRFGERHVDAGAQGRLLSADTVFAGTLLGTGNPRRRRSTPGWLGPMEFGSPAMLA